MKWVIRWVLVSLLGTVAWATVAFDLETEMGETAFREAGLHRLNERELSFINDWLGSRIGTPTAAPAKEDTIPVASAGMRLRVEPSDQPQSVATAVGSHESFGTEHIEKPAAEAPTSRITSSLPGRFTGWDGKTVFRLENGQVWRQTDSSRFRWVKENPKVTIERGAMGAYYLRVENKASVVRVRRIK